MGISENKTLVAKAIDCLDQRDLGTLASLIHEDGSWSIPYRPDKFQFAGFRDKPGVLELLTGFLAGFDTFSFKADSFTAEADRVIVEANSAGTGPGSATYQNVYLMIFLLKDGKIHTVREYFDPFQVNEYVRQLTPSE